MDCFARGRFLGVRWWASCCALACACGTAASTDTDASSSSSDETTASPPTTTASPTTTATTNDATSTSTDSSGDTTTSTTGDVSSTSDDTSGDTTTSTTSEGTDTTGTDDSSGGSTTGEALPPCEAGCMVEFECGTEWKSAEACIEWCEANLVLAAEFSLFCQMAWSNLSACFGTLTCEEYAEYLEPTMFPYPCATESDSLAFECKGQ